MRPETVPLGLRIRQAAGRPLVVGHRGAMGYRPENTMASFRHAVELGADLVELDVHLSRDGVLVAIHDETLERTTDGAGLVGERTLPELRALDAGSWFGDAYAGERIPTFEEVLDWAASQGVLLDVEIKSGPVVYPGIGAAVVEALSRHGMTERALVISFDHVAVQRVKALDDRVATGVLYAGRPVDPVALARAAGADALLPHWAFVREEDVRSAHAAGLAVAPWVSSDPHVLRRLISLGVDGIGTNHPDVLRGIVDEAPPEGT
ncbi:glycerophosphodiester phosphodiesterase [Myxococcota bacterium]|nr:glycerophosphodiester phosphodiesterase [Myxococcota bacterium]